MSRDQDGAIKKMDGPMMGAEGWRSRDGFSVRALVAETQIVALWDDQGVTAGVIDHIAEAIDLGDQLLKAYVPINGDLQRLSIYQRSVPHHEGQDSPITHALVFTRSIRGDTGDVNALIGEVRWMDWQDGWLWTQVDAVNEQLDRWSAGLITTAP